jgi:SAM-dependent methyltransferase
MGIARDLAKSLVKVVVGYLLVVMLTTAVLYPSRADKVAPPQNKDAAVAFYSNGFTGDAPEGNGAVSDYGVLNQRAVTTILPIISRFVEQYGLGDKRILEVGSGTGYLQDVVADYIGLDISPTAARFYHKPFVEGSATDLPFHDGYFDALWSIYVLEHVPTPEQALTEMRRVVKDGGLLYLKPALNCVPWAAQGYPVRPYGDFGVGGKIVKAGVDSGVYPVAWDLYLVQERLIRGASGLFESGPTRFHYIPITPNYDQFWMPDSDAVNSLDSYEMTRWFTSRGDECLNCGQHPILEMHDLIIKVHKPSRV